jgi:hypothetical protein
MRKLFPNRPSFENAGGPKWRLDLKTRVLTMLVVLTDVSGNFTMSWGLKHQSWVVLGTTLLLIWFLSRTILPGWADLSYVLPVTSFSYVFTKSHRSLEGRFPKSRYGLTGGAGRRW